MSVRAEFAVVTATLEDVIVTGDLDRRPAPESDHAQVKRAIQDIASKMAYSAEEVLPRFVDLAMELGGGVAAGISILEREPKPQVFRWTFLRGSLAAFEGATTPRDFSPCGITLDHDQPTLARHAERYYSWISDVKIVVPEVLLVPLHRGSEEQLGTIWIVSDQTDHFNRAHARQITELASFVSIALRMMETESQLKTALNEQEALAKEMSHRVKNVFNIIGGMVQLSARSAHSKDQLTEVLTGRIRALSKAHSLVRRSFALGEREIPGPDLRGLLEAIVSPYEAASSQTARFKLRGPVVPLGTHATNGIALLSTQWSRSRCSEIFQSISTSPSDQGFTGDPEIWLEAGGTTGGSWIPIWSVEVLGAWGVAPQPLVLSEIRRPSPDVPRS